MGHVTKEPARTREQSNAKLKKSKKGCRIIRIPISAIEYEKCQNDCKLFRAQIDLMYKSHPELFPQDMCKGYFLHDKVKTKKLECVFRRISIGSGKQKEVYKIMPCDICPYMTGSVSEVEKGLLLKGFGVPGWVISYILGKDEMYWERQERSLGRFSIVGTTVKKGEKLPKDYVCDEKFTWMGKKLVYVAMTSAQECVLGSSIAMSTTEADFTVAYGVFAKEARNIAPKFAPKTVNTDGFKSTQNAWKNNFKNIVIVLCFLHSVLSIKKLIKGQYMNFKPLMDKIWQTYRAENRQDFENSMEDIYIWTQENIEHAKVKEKVNKMYNRTFEYAVAYDHEKAHRTSNQVDRQMNAFDRVIYNRQYFHGHRATSELKVRAWALLHNFMPYAQRTMKVKNPKLYPSRAAELNCFAYRQNWLENLFCSASLNGFKC